MARNVWVMRWLMTAMEAKLRATLELADALSHWSRFQRYTATEYEKSGHAMEGRGEAADETCAGRRPLRFEAV
jgi:hypothetical protein